MTTSTLASLLSADTIVALSRLGDLTDEQMLWLIREFPAAVDWRARQSAGDSLRDVLIEAYPPEGKIAVIKVARAALNLGLKESKDLIESAPALLKAGLPELEASALAREMEAAGATVSVRPAAS